jgi:hypothetical protein
MIRFTEHAIERFVEYWRPGMRLEEAEQTLRSLIARAARTRRNARGTDARIYLAETERGERICLVVRGGWVVTVLGRRTWESSVLGGGAREQAPSAARQRTTLMASLFEDGIAARREKAESILASFRAGRPVSRKTLRRVAAVLGLRMEQLFVAEANRDSEAPRRAA